MMVCLGRSVAGFSLSRTLMLSCVFLCLAGVCLIGVSAQVGSLAPRLTAPVVVAGNGAVTCLAMYFLLVQRKVGKLQGLDGRRSQGISQQPRGASRAAQRIANGFL